MLRDRVEVKSLDEVRLMRRAGHIVAGMLAEVRGAIAPGVTTGALDEIAAQFIADQGARSNFKGYHGYPATLCISVNEEIVHGIPGSRVIREGDVVSVDGGCSVGGSRGKRWHGDSAFTVVVGEGDPVARALSDVTEEAMWAAIAALAGARRVGVVGDAVEAVVASHARAGTRLGIVREYVGHGIGSQMHQPPEVLNYSSNDRGPRLREGVCLAVEPMLVAGSPENETLADDWTVVTLDRSPAAHWEHSVAIVGGGVHVLTATDGGAAGLAAHGVTPVPLD